MLRNKELLEKTMLFYLGCCFSVLLYLLHAVSVFFTLGVILFYVLIVLNISSSPVLV